MSATDGELHCRLIGGPLDGLAVTEWKGIQTIVMNSEQDKEAAPVDIWHIYKRPKPDVITREGLTEFHYFATKEHPTE
jgi:hypothetical protein